MGATPTCPRCGAPSRPPGLWTDTWTCADHGSVAPLHGPVQASDEALRQVAARSRVPVWLPYPLPGGWLVTGLRWAGSDRTGPVATVLACSGPHPLPARRADGESVRTAELLVVAEEPGVGLAARLAGMAEVDPGHEIALRAPAVKLRADGHDVPLWWLGEPAAASEGTGGAAGPDDRPARFVGEAGGVWLWVLLWPSDADALLVEPFRLIDLREPEHDLIVPFGALSPRV